MYLVPPLFSLSSPSFYSPDLGPSLNGTARFIFALDRNIELNLSSPLIFERPAELKTLTSVDDFTGKHRNENINHMFIRVAARKCYPQIPVWDRSM